MRLMQAEWIVGINPVEAALAEGAARVRELWLEHDAHNPRLLALAQQAQQLGIAVQTRPRAALERIAAGARHQGIAAHCVAAPVLDETALPELIAAAGHNTLLLVLDGVTDPHNLGACLRSAAAAGAQAVIVPRDRAAALSPVVRRAAAGGAEHVPLLQVTNLARSLRGMKEAGVWLVGLDGADDVVQTLYALDLRGPLALVLGAEGEGMRRLTREACDHLARIPMIGAMQSLNVSVATGIALFEALRQRGAGAKS